MEKNEIVNVPKLIYQLLNTKVVIQKMCEHSERATMSETEYVLPNRSALKDSIQRYCPKCKTMKVDKHDVKVRKFCPKCEAVLKYVCSKCNIKQYCQYGNLSSHWKRCTGQAADTDTCEKLNQADFLVEKTKIDYAREIIRYCSRCNEVDESCSKWADNICRNCNRPLQFQCNRCEAYYKGSHGLIYHMQTKCYPSKYKCNYCDLTKPSWDRMRVHVSRVHYEKKIHCPRCDTAMKNEASLQLHLEHCEADIQM